MRKTSLPSKIILKNIALITASISLFVRNIEIAACILTGVIFIINGINTQKNNQKIQMCIFYVFTVILMGIYNFVGGYMLSIGLMIILFMI